jgi:hypothetical protein
MKTLLLIWSLSTQEKPTVTFTNSMAECEAAVEVILKRVDNIHFGIACDTLPGINGNNQKRGEK